MRIVRLLRLLVGAAALAAGAAGLTVGLARYGEDPALSPLMAPVSGVVTSSGGTLYMQVTEVTIADWARCHAEGACALSLKPPLGAAPESTPATGLNAQDVAQYLGWLNRRTGQGFRLPTEAEWYAAAADVLPETPDPLFTDPALSWASAYLLAPAGDRRLRPTASHSTSRDGIADLDGNVWEWTQDCYGGEAPERCAAFVVAGEHRAVVPFLVRDPARGGCAVGQPPPHLGMRVVSERPVPGS